MTDDPKPHSGSNAAAISNGVVKLLAEYTGRGPTQARTTISENAVMVLLQQTLTKGERQLADHGQGEHVLLTRQMVQRMMRDDVVALVEAQLQRKVVAFMSANHLDPDMAAEILVLEAEGMTGDGCGSGLQ